MLSAPQLLRAEMPLVRYINQELAQNGILPDSEDYIEHFNMSIKYYRQFGNIDLINKHY